jgi:hypothetical protein
MTPAASFFTLLVLAVIAYWVSDLIARRYRLDEWARKLGEDFAKKLKGE